MKAEIIVFVAKSRSGLSLSKLEQIKLGKKVSKTVSEIAAEKKKLDKKASKMVSKMAASNRIAIFQTSDDQSDLAVLIKNGIGNDRSDLYNIFSRSVTDCVSHTISYIDRYTTSERVLVIFVDNREFITEFAKQVFGKKLSYDPTTDQDSVKILNCNNVTLQSA